jgi:thiosulfate/3-mercaptopyruvate sulfurtransferase
MPDPRPPASPNLVTTDWLAARLGEPEISIVDGSFYLPALKRDAKAEFAAGHIPGAVFFDIDAIADHSSELPHMLPGTTQFDKDVGALGIGRDDTIVIYDGIGLGGAPRVWWTFKIFGANKVYILDGGLRKWKAEGRPVDSGPALRTPKNSIRIEHAGGRRRRRRAMALTANPPRWSTPGRPTASAARPRSRARASVPATCRAPRTCRSPN